MHKILNESLNSGFYVDLGSVPKYRSCLLESGAASTRIIGQIFFIGGLTKNDLALVAAEAGAGLLIKRCKFSNRNLGRFHADVEVVELTVRETLQIARDRISHIAERARR